MLCQNSKHLLKFSFFLFDFAFMQISKNIKTTYLLNSIRELLFSQKHTKCCCFSVHKGTTKLNLNFYFVILFSYYKSSLQKLVNIETLSFFSIFVILKKLLNFKYVTLIVFISFQYVNLVKENNVIKQNNLLFWFLTCKLYFTLQAY